MDSPFRIEPPFVISFSGGRTSGYMLRRILEAYDGDFPADSAIIFTNTGKERPETLDFVERCSQRWSVRIVWLEYAKWAPHKFIETSYATACRAGEPFSQIIESKQLLPNPVMRFCTQWLKIKPSNRYARHVRGWGKSGYRNAIGLRADEPRRVAKLRKDGKSSPGEEPIAPLAAAGVTLSDVETFWAKQPFKLELEPHEGNCDLCFLKGRNTINRIVRDRPDLAEWWADKEQQFKGKTRKFAAGRFRKDRPGYAQVLAQVKAQPEIDWLEDERLPECRCTD
jgi:3'-phosphoadenosine 5'-phosphosulfate sulfotransferase (PAPS reductase)/FAD synthetase